MVLVGKAKGREIPLPASQFIIGRSSQCHLRPHSELVSKFHCAIVSKGQQVIIRDLKSRNSTYVNGEAISKPVRVKDNDILAVGPLRFRIAIDVEKERPVLRPIREDHISWLMEGTDDFEMDSSSETQVIELPPEFLEANSEKFDQTVAESSELSNMDDSSAQKLSAGKYLKDYFEKKRKDAQI